MLRTGLAAAGLLVAAVVLVAGGRAEPAPPTHLCGALDKQFVHAAILSSTAMALLGQDYQAGEITPREAIAETRTAELGIRNTAPRDTALKLARTLMHGMFLEYARAVRAQWQGGDAGAHMYRSYALADYAHQVLADAAPQLGKLGCSVQDLLTA